VRHQFQTWSIARFLSCFLVGCWVTSGYCVPVFGEDYAVQVQPGVQVKMRDGIELATDIYRPITDGRFPVLLQRTPYNRTGERVMAHFLASKGYVVIIQDTRGRFDSKGEFYPFRYESQDGYDTVEWAAELECSNGKVGMFGGSYVGATQMLAAISKPPHLVAIFPYVTASEYYDGWTYQSGALMQWFASSWSSGLSVDTLRRKASAGIRARQGVTGLPVESYVHLNLPPLETLTPYFRDWVEHERDDAYWKPWKISDHYSELSVKALHAGGWHDIFVKGTITNYMGMRQSAATEEARQNQRLLIGPWAHAATSPEGKIGDVVFGKDAVLDMQQITLRWSDYALKGVANEFASGAPVRIFVLGENVWRNEKEFPLARTRMTKYFLHANQGANSISGDGKLSTGSAGSEKPDIFEYDPMNPVPTIGGRLCCGNELPPGPADQRPNEARREVLVYSTPPLESDLEATGFVSVDLYAASTAKDTDFTALLVDVDPSGYARYLADGIVRARYRNSMVQAESITPGNVYQYRIDLWTTSNVFKKGHRIRFYVSSSNFPRFNRNLNTGEMTLGATKMVKASQKVFHDAKYPSALNLPVIPR
jgi:putative CocE/NonD family hydrolase